MFNISDEFKEKDLVCKCYKEFVSVVKIKKKCIRKYIIEPIFIRIL